MNGKETEKITGISRRNLRFYEDQGLINPQRNPQNDYRDYSDIDIERLKIIRGLRTIDVPLELIKEYFEKEISLEELSIKQEANLICKQKEIETALSLCRSLQDIKELKGSTVDTLLDNMEKPEIKKNLFYEWKNDYKIVSENEHKAFFYFIPDHPVKNSYDMVIALYEYADKKGSSIQIVKESMNPTFIMDGITYNAACASSYSNNLPDIMYPEIYCNAVNKEDIYKKPLNKKQKFMKFFYSLYMIPICFLIFSLLWAGHDAIAMFKTAEFWIIFSVLIVIVVLADIFFKKLNDKKKEK